MAVEQDVALEVQELQRVERDAGEDRVGGQRLGRAGSSVHFFDQSERTITTEPFGILPFFFSNVLMSDTWSAYFGSFLTCGTIEITTSGRTA